MEYVELALEQRALSDSVLIRKQLLLYRSELGIEQLSEPSLLGF